MNPSKSTQNIFEVLKSYSLYLAFLIIFIAFSLLNENFLSINNVLNIIVQSAIIAIIAVGQTMVILTSGIDLSVGSIVGAVGIGIGLLMVAGVSIPVAVVLGVIMGIVFGLINGVIISYGRVPAFITTLGMMGIARGFGLALNEGKPVAGLPQSFEKIASTSVAGIPSFVFYTLIIYVIMFFILERTKFGRHIYAIGGNRDAARLSGVKVKVVEMIVYLFSGLFSGLGAVLLTARLNYATPVAGTGYELDTIAAVVIGGTALSGGQGKIIGTLVGALMLGILRNGLTILNVSSFFQQIIIGAVIIIAVFMDKINEKKNN
ncbi:ribose ABC transporter permease [Ornatilinea apprima]|uniref:Ribose ABC transporter permease n=1 Tax=Ornatilinea apprima TaxID=1134406 RepID=A0A0P6X9Z1_9CHLR|nr:ABC transporter permease [Ornatilinea apprima]KPL78880.1 ribose ABC transporter permease [Ornatilinea apprima]